MFESVLERCSEKASNSKCSRVPALEPQSFFMPNLIIGCWKRPCYSHLFYSNIYRGPAICQAAFKI